ncbi:hypothetical protein [Vibrio owensii]|uniref:hypothetical protein n=1 Tax=Vibrio harveyi group TaxID=717610 RepID=UPI003CC5E60A
MTHAYDLSQFMPKDFSKALKDGCIPFSSIDVLTRYLKAKQVESMSLSEIVGDLGLAQYNDCSISLEEITKDYEIKSVLTNLSFLAHNYFGNQVVALEEIESVGLQVDMMLFKDSGKLAYSGVVSLGSARPWDDGFLDTAMSKQDFINGDASDYSVVITDTPLNHNDYNFKWCCSALRKR